MTDKDIIGSLDDLADEIDKDVREGLDSMLGDPDGELAEMIG